MSKAEIKLSLASIESGISYNAFGALMPVLKEIDPQSRVWEAITLGPNKLSYTISDSLGPHFREKHLRAARKAIVFSLSLDAASTKRGGLSKDLGEFIHLISVFNLDAKIIVFILDCISPIVNLIT